MDFPGLTPGFGFNRSRAGSLPFFIDSDNHGVSRQFYGIFFCCLYILSACNPKRRNYGVSF
jgi:hypothetical protein